MIDALRIVRHGHLSTEAQKYSRCANCAVVDTSFDRVKIGTPCPKCGAPSTGGEVFYDLSVLVFVDLIQEAYNSLPPGNDGVGDNMERVHAHSGSVLILYCILKELLLLRFIDSLMTSQNIPNAIRERLVADNDSHSRRLLKLFPALTGAKWNEALDLLRLAMKYDWIAIDEFIEKATRARNEFIHEGNFQVANRQIASECLMNLFPLLELFVALNNTYLSRFA